jgi:galactose mutarotase-like enzyme
VDRVVIESEAMRVGVLPTYGARVVSLFDKATGREWIAGGGQSANSGEDAVYGGDEAAGWDECFPTVSPCDATDTTWRRRLRDHGELWGRAWSVDRHTPDALTTSYATAAFRFSRTLSVVGPALQVSYAVENRTAEDMPYLWALHGLLALTSDDRVILPGVTEVGATYLALAGHALHADAMPWPDTNDVLPFPLDAVQPATRQFAGKFYAHGIAGRQAAVGHGRQWLSIGWDESIDDLGLWFNYGGWPQVPGGYHGAIEPTTASADHLGEALRSGNAAWIAPGATASWTITLTLKDAP